MLTSSSMHC